MLCKVFVNGKRKGYNRQPARAHPAIIRMYNTNGKLLSEMLKDAADELGSQRK